MFVVSHGVIFLFWIIVNIKKDISLKYLLFPMFIVSAWFTWIAPNVNLLNHGIDVGLLHHSISYFLLLIIMVFFTPIRRPLVSNKVFKVIQKKLPPIGETERIALEAGDTWWDKELFSANPNYQTLTAVKDYQLTADEQSFLNNQVIALCSLVDPYQARQDADLSPQAWDYIKQNKFLALVMPKEYGGLGFSHTAHSLIVSKLASHSSVLGVTVMVPNSLGPSELILKYGTDAQKTTYLSRLADGQEIPCFSLTSNYAGSDAGGIIDTGIVCEIDHEGKKVLGLKLNWDKRYITLSPVATLIGLAFKAYDPDGLLPKNHPLHGNKDLGITCALVPRNTPGVTIGNRHNPLGCGFMNGPNSGQDVILPIEDCVIGGINRLGEGWKMLMECLSIGRGISLPSTANVGIQKALLSTSLYANIRQQFGTHISNFEAIGEKLANTLMRSYIAKANCWQTTNALDAGIVPATVSAIIKYRNTEMGRQSIMDAMDIQAGKAIIAGPKNCLTDIYLNTPVGITVEGANILTRNLMVFGQGVMRCHPYLFSEVAALNATDQTKGMQQFDKIFYNHVAFSINNFCKLIALKIGLSSSTTMGSAVTNKHHRLIKNLSIKFSFLADLCLLIFGGTLKRKEIISGEFADALSTLYEMTAVLNYYDAKHGQDQDAGFLVDQVISHSVIGFHVAIGRIIDDLPINALLRYVLRSLLVGGRANNNVLKSAKLLKLAKLTSNIEWLKTYVCPDLYFSDKAEDPISVLLHAHQANIKQQPILKRLSASGIKYDGSESFASFVTNLLHDKIIQETEKDILIDAREKVFAAIIVDDFSTKEMLTQKI